MFFLAPKAEMPVEMKAEIQAIYPEYLLAVAKSGRRFFIFTPLFFCCSKTGVPSLGNTLVVKFFASTREIVDAKFV
jgi:hypothetical protein